MNSPANKPRKLNSSGKPKYDSIKTPVLMSKEAFALWDKMARKLGVSRDEVLEKAVREMAARNDVTVTPKEIRALVGVD